MQLAEETYHLSQQFPKHETYGLGSQIQRAAVPIPEDHIVADIGSLMQHLHEYGITPVASEYCPASFGDYYVDMVGNGVQFRLIRDRGQYMLHGSEKENLNGAGLWRSFDDKREFVAAVFKCATSQRGG